MDSREQETGLSPGCPTPVGSGFFLGKNAISTLSFPLNSFTAATCQLSAREPGCSLFVLPANQLQQLSDAAESKL